MRQSKNAGRESLLRNHRSAILATLELPKLESCVNATMIARLGAAALIGTLAASAVPQSEIGADLTRAPRIQSALEFVRGNEPEVIEYQIQLTEIPAPPFKEERRAAAYRAMFEERGLTDVRIDSEGNVLGVRPGRSARPHLVFTAHLDTVFPDETIRVVREGAILRAPGIGDDGRGLAVVLGVIDALNGSAIETDGPITFVGTVGEEGLGDLRGVKHLFHDELKGRIDRFISVDGGGYSIKHVGVGSYRYRVAFVGRGGHSYGSFGVTNPIHALGRLIAKIADFQVPESPKTTFSVGRIFGGTSINAIAYEAAFEVDMRSADKDSLETVHDKFLQAAAAALAEEKARWKGEGELELDLKRVGLRPAGHTPAESPEVRAVVSINRVLGLDVEMRESSSDSNVGMSLGVPSITIGPGGAGNGAHSPGESFDTTDSWKGTQRALLVAIALSSEGLR